MVTIDELQNIDAEGAKRLRVLHEGRHGCPVQIVGAGLQHTLDVLRQHGISRTVPPIELGLLARGETYEALVKGYSVGTGAELADDVAELLAERSQDFPQHVTGYLQGAVQTYERRGDVVGDGIREAVAHGDDVRRRYYDARLDAVGGIHAVLELVALFDDCTQMTVAGVEEGVAKQRREWSGHGAGGHQAWNAHPQWKHALHRHPVVSQPLAKEGGCLQGETRRKGGHLSSGANLQRSRRLEDLSGVPAQV